MDRHSTAVAPVAGQLHGEFCKYADIRSEPSLAASCTADRVGTSCAALRRTARHGDGWHPVDFIAPRRCRRRRCGHLQTLKRMTEEGRDFALPSPTRPYDNGIPDRDGARRSFSGTAQDIAGDIRSFAAIGVHELIFDFRGQSTADSIERLQRFAAEVMPKDWVRPLSGMPRGHTTRRGA
jgi:hypothetical protein